MRKWLQNDDVLAGPPLKLHVEHSRSDRVCVCVCVCPGGEPAAGAAGCEGRQWSGGAGAPGGRAVGSGHHRLQVRTA